MIYKFPQIINSRTHKHLKWLGVLVFLFMSECDVVPPSIWSMPHTCT